MSQSARLENCGSKPPTSRVSCVDGQDPGAAGGDAVVPEHVGRQAGDLGRSLVAQDPQALIDDDRADTRPLRIGGGAQRPELTGELVRRPQVVVVGERDPRRVDHRQSGVACVGHAGWLFVAVPAHPLVDDRGQHGRRVVRRSVVDDDQAEIDVDLAEHRPDGVHHQLRSVVGRHDDGHVRGGRDHVWLRRALFCRGSGTDSVRCCDGLIGAHRRATRGRRGAPVLEAGGRGPEPVASGARPSQRCGRPDVRRRSRSTPHAGDLRGAAPARCGRNVLPRRATRRGPPGPRAADRRRGPRGGLALARTPSRGGCRSAAAARLPAGPSARRTGRRPTRSPVPTAEGLRRPPRCGGDRRRRRHVVAVDGRRARLGARRDECGDRRRRSPTSRPATSSSSTTRSRVPLAPSALDRERQRALPWPASSRSRPGLRLQLVTLG